MPMKTAQPWLLCTVSTRVSPKHSIDDPPHVAIMICFFCFCVSSSVRRATFRHERCCCGEVRKSWPSTSARVLITRWPQINVNSGKLYTIGIFKLKKSLKKLNFSVMNWESTQLTSQRLTDSSFVARRAVFFICFQVHQQVVARTT